jgi:hypothetical protein
MSFKWISSADEPSVSCKAAVNRQRHAEYEAGARTAKPENRRGDLVGTAQPGDWLIAHDLLDGVRPHSPSHGCIDHARAYGIDANATRRIVHGGALCQPDHAMLGRVIGSPARLADEAAKRGTVDDGAAALGAHLEQLVFHASPDTAQIDGGHVIEGPRGFIGQIAHRTQDTGIVERHVQLTEGRDRALDHGRDLRLVRHVAGDADRPVTGRGQLPGRGAQRVLVDIAENDRGARLGECLRGRESDAGTAAGDKGNLALKIINWIHVLVSSIMYVGSDLGDAVGDPQSTSLFRLQALLGLQQVRY